MLANPTVTSAIIGANTVEQLAELLPAVSLTLSPDEKKRLDNLKSPT
jgi:aryl-alcohol dehydrogenase-like predicted oxidoreductase